MGLPAEAAPNTPRSRASSSRMGAVAEWMIVNVAGQKLLVKSDQKGVSTHSAELEASHSYEVKLHESTGMAYLWNETTQQSQWAAWQQHAAGACFKNTKP